MLDSIKYERIKKEYFIYFILLYVKYNVLYYFLDILSNEENEMLKYPIRLDHNYSKDSSPPTTSGSIKTNMGSRNTLSVGIQNITSKVYK